MEKNKSGILPLVLDEKMSSHKNRDHVALWFGITTKRKWEPNVHTGE